MSLATPRKYSIACMPGDGIGTEVIAAGVQVLKAIARTHDFELNFENFDWSSETYKKTGKYIPDGGLDELKKHDAILFGAVGAPGTFLCQNPRKTQSVMDARLSGLSYRCAGSYIALGSASSDLSTAAAIRQRPTDKSLSRHAVASS